LAITFVGTSAGDQGQFNRLGKIGAIIDLIDTLAGTDLPTSFKDLLDLFDDCPVDVRASVEDGPQAMVGLQDAINPATLAEIAVRILIDMTHADSPLAQLTLLAAMQEVLRQLKAGSYKVTANTVAAAVTQSGLTGTGIAVASVKGVDGVEMQNLLQEELQVRVLSATELLVEGRVAEPDKLSHNWPQGSGASASYVPVAVDSADSYVQNGSLDAFTANVPDDWTLKSGTTAGTHVAEEGTIVHTTGGKSLKILGNGSTLAGVEQVLTGLEAKTQLAVIVWVRMSTTPAAGALTVDLHDGTNPINDEAGNANSGSIALTGVSTTWLPFTFSFRLPDPLPATIKLRIFQGTAITNTHNAYVDDVALAVMRQPTDDARTPFLQFFDGTVPFSVDDNAADGTGTFKIAVTNDRAGLWQQLFDRLFNMTGLGLQLPISGSTTISDSLIA
jgi:hypothetical protein